MKERIKKIISKTNKKFKKMCTNCNWEVRYNNLEKKYMELEEENKRLREELDHDNNILKIKDKNKQLRRYKEIIKNLREETKQK